MKVTITDEEVKFLANLIVLSEQAPNVTVEELGNNWANWVASPVTHHTTKRSSDDINHCGDFD